MSKLLPVIADDAVTIELEESTYDAIAERAQQRGVTASALLDHILGGDLVDPRFRRPKTLADCHGDMRLRPCPWVSCKWNLLIDVVDDGGIVLNAGHQRAEGGGRVIPANPRAEERFRDEAEDAVDWWFDELPDVPIPSCAIDEAVHRQPTDNNITLLDEIAEMMYVTRERVRQIEHGALGKLKGEGVDLIAELKEIVAELRRLRDEKENGG